MDEDFDDVGDGDEEDEYDYEEEEDGLPYVSFSGNLIFGICVHDISMVLIEKPQFY